MAQMSVREIGYTTYAYKQVGCRLEEQEQRKKNVIIREGGLEQLVILLCTQGVRWGDI